MNVRGAVRAGAVLVLTGCVYYNALYNAERLFERSEAERLAGQDSLARVHYRQVVEKAARGFRMEPEGEWADDALLLMGRAYLSVGDLRAARAALERAEDLAGDEPSRLAARLYLGASYVAAGLHARAIPLLDEALRGLRDGSLRAEGHLWRGRALLASGQLGPGWWDLTQAAAGRRPVRVSAALERLASGVRFGARERAQEGVDQLLSISEASRRPDTVVTLVRAAADRWGPASAAELLAGADTAVWGPGTRGRLRLVRAVLLRESGDSVAASLLVEGVADGFGEAAAQARIELARWALGEARDLVDVRDAEAVLLPAEGDPGVARLLTDLRALSELAEAGLSEPLGWFAAGEIARDRLGAPVLARGLFLAYADQVPDAPWAAKALLAALDVTSDEGGRAWLRGRLEGRAASPYVLAARGEPAPGLEPLEEELARRLEEMRTR